MDITKIISLPVYYDPEGQYIFDADGNMIAEIRCWGHLQDAKKQDFMGEYIATCINMYEALKSRGEVVNVNL